MAKIEIKKTELVWKGKYDDDGKLVPVEKPGPYPFQRIEVINQPRLGNEELNKQTSLVYDLYKFIKVLKVILSKPAGATNLFGGIINL